VVLVCPYAFFCSVCGGGGEKTFHLIWKEKSENSHADLMILHVNLLISDDLEFPTQFTTYLAGH
jgi:hypothetical protein